MQKNYCNYPVEFVDDAFGESSVLTDLLKKVSGSDTPKALLVADMNLVQHTEGLGAKIGRYVQKHGIRLAGKPVILGGGERVKADNLQSAAKVISAALLAKLGHNDFILALGGGTVLDIAGYAAAQVRGGVKIVRLPTSPAAMMNAAYAEWASVDSASVKDALRVPSVPSAVVIDVNFAKTALDGVWRGGISEAVRLALACDSALYKKIEKLVPAYRQRGFSALRTLVKSVYDVYRKKGPTALGLWSESRLESLSGYKLPYGYALAIGTYIDIEYATKRGLLEVSDRDKVVELLRACGSLDSIKHSTSLLSQPDALLIGLDDWSLATGSASVTVPTAIGKSKEDEAPDREAYKSVFASLA